ncbi:MAG: radical SAM protein [Chloroflexi bacterium]|nr:radical SAM protein [Chloroflexota bacterium]
MKSLRAYRNLFKLRLNMLLRREVVDHYPIVAYIEPTLFCNLRCPACPTGLRLNLRSPVRLDWDLFTAAIDEIGEYIFELYMYNWGEPLLHPETPAMIRYAKQQHMQVTLSTNFSVALSDDYLAALIDSGLDRIVISLDGVSAATYGHYRRQGDHGRVRENMSRLRAARDHKRRDKPEIVWQFLVFAHNEHEISTAKACYREWGADCIIVEGAQMPVSPFDAGFSPSTQSQYNLYHPGHPYQRSGQRQLRDGRPCSWLYGAIVLNPDGRISPCCGTAAARDDFGTYSGKESLMSIYNSQPYQGARAINRHTQPRNKQPGVAMIRGMAAENPATRRAETLICAVCPIPFRQDDIHKTITRVSYQTLHHLLRGKLRAVAALVAMGGPSFYGVWRWLRSHIRELLRDSLGSR